MTSPLARLFSHARAHRADIRLATFYSIANKFFDILPEVLIGIAVDTVVKQQGSWLAGLGVVDVKQQLLVLTAATAIIWGLESLTEYLYEVKWRNLAQSIQHELRLETYGHVQGLDLAWFENRRSGEILATLNDDINQLERFLNGGLSTILQVLAGSLMCAVIFFALSPTLACVALLPVPFILYGAFWFQRRLEPRYSVVRAAAARINAAISNNLGGIATIKAYAAEQHELAQIGSVSADYRAANAAAIRFAAAITPVIRLAILAGFMATLLIGGWQVLAGTLAVGAYSVLVFLTQRLLWPLTHLAEITDMYQRAAASITRVLDLLATPPGLPAGGHPLPMARPRGDIRFESVSFAYEANRPVLHDLSLAIAAGESVALVGSTGSGKSTLVKLLLNFYAPSGGRITLDGVDIATLDAPALRRQIGFVAQEPFLIDGTVADNIAYGTFTVPREAVIAAARAAEAHEFILQLAQGYDTPVGERGVKLSGGQRQRIAIARALLKDPCILVLDEATSAVDNDTEAAIQRSLATITRGRTTLMIAHRLSTIRHVDRIVLLEGGRIAEMGDHPTLLARGGVYAALWRLQTGA
jgi:ATP-binding cassette subfamily B protein